MRALLLLLMLLAAGLAGCTDSGDGDGTDPDDGGDGGNDALVDDDGNSTSPDDAPTMAIDISAAGTYPFNPSLDPARFEVPAGTMLTITFTNSDTNPFVGHDLRVSGVDEQTPVLANGESTELTFLVDLEPGEYPYWCAVGNHREQGMEGVMVVT